MTDLAHDLLEQPTATAVARLALEHLDQARAACTRLADHDDPEALHDFRVAVRRLRTLLRAFSDDLGNAIPKKLERRVRELARTTTPGRDAEVQLAWLEQLGSRRGPGLAWLRTRLTQGRDRAYHDIRRSIPGAFRAVDRRLRRRLNGALAAPARDGAVFAASLVYQVRAESAALRQEFAAARSAADADAVHGTRIAVKRLRYLLEPLVVDHAGTRALVERLKQLQTALGQLHDLQILVRDLGEEAAEAAAEGVRRKHERLMSVGGRGKRPGGSHPSPTGVLAIASLAAVRQQAIFERDLAEWREGALEILAGDLARWTPGPRRPVRPKRGSAPAPRRTARRRVSTARTDQPSR